MTKEGLQIWYKCESVRGYKEGDIITVLKKMPRNDIQIVYPGEQLDFEREEIVQKSTKKTADAGRKRTLQNVQSSENSAETNVDDDIIDFFGYKIPKYDE